MKYSPLLMLTIAGLSLNAHAVCVMPDGSLDDKSASAATVAVEMLPACERSAPPAVGTPAAEPTRDVHANAADKKLN